MTLSHCPELWQSVPETYYYETGVDGNLLAGVYAHPSFVVSDDCAKGGEMLPDSSWLCPDFATPPSTSWNVHTTTHSDYRHLPVELPVLTPSSSRSPSPGGNAEALYEHCVFPEPLNVDHEGAVCPNLSPVYNEPIEDEVQDWTAHQYASPLELEALASFSLPYQFGDALGLAYVSCQFGTECGMAIQNVTPKGVCEHLLHHHTQDVDRWYAAQDGFKCIWQTNGELCGAARCHDVELCEHIVAAHLNDPQIKWSWSRMPCVAPEHTIACEQLCESPAAIV